MCAISGSYDVNKLRYLYDLNAYRGVVSSSFALFDEEGLSILARYDRELKESDWAFLKSRYDGLGYMLCHSQAPTSAEEDLTTIHPAFTSVKRAYKDKIHSDRYFLWHNGIIKQKEMDRINKWCGLNYGWDTQMLVDFYALFGPEKLSDIDGTFACVLYEERRDTPASLWLFRNEISPLFVDDELNISSTKDGDMKPLEPGRVFQLEVENKELHPTNQQFATKENPYFFFE